MHLQLECLPYGLLLPVQAVRTPLVLKVSPSERPSAPIHCVSVTYINFSDSPDPFWLL